LKSVAPLAPSADLPYGLADNQLNTQPCLVMLAAGLLFKIMLFHSTMG